MYARVLNARLKGGAGWGAFLHDLCQWESEESWFLSFFSSITSQLPPAIDLFPMIQYWSFHHKHHLINLLVQANEIRCFWFLDDRFRCAKHSSTHPSQSESVSRKAFRKQSSSPRFSLSFQLIIYEFLCSASCGASRLVCSQQQQKKTFTTRSKSFCLGN